MTKRSVVHATFVIERIYDHPPAKVYNAFADPAAKRVWFVEGEDWTTESYENEFRVGGYERSAFRYKGGPIILNDTTYQDIIPNERIIIAYWMSVGENRISASLATMEFKPKGKGTLLVFTEQGAFLDGHDSVAQREEGTRGLLEVLDNYLRKH